MSGQYGYNQLLKYLFIVFVIGYALFSILIFNGLINNLKTEERHKIELWAEATQLFASGDENADMELVLRVLQNNTTIPVILLNKSNNEISSRNISLPKSDTTAFLLGKIALFEKKHNPIIIEDFNQYVYYDDSSTLKQLQLYPYIQFGIIGILVLLAFLIIRNAIKAEQNNVWVGLSKETAHQLGTPISSLNGWIAYLKMKDISSETIDEINKDIVRLETITNRFSKIGSKDDFSEPALQEAVHCAVSYLEGRISKRVSLLFDFPIEPIYVRLNQSLFDWVIENMTKNAIDAMNGEGQIKYAITANKKHVFLDISDTGKGIAKSKFKDIFRPGYTTKELGWGLGLSLAKRIIELYHKGRIVVKYSEKGKGTTFRITLRRTFLKT